MKALSASWLLQVVLYVAGAGCAAAPASGDEESLEVSEAALGAATLDECLPNGADPSGGASAICNGRSVQIFAEPACCSGRAKVVCPGRGESSETLCTR